MGDGERLGVVLYKYAEAASKVGRATLKGLNGGTPFCGGPAFWEAATASSGRSPSTLSQRQAENNQRLEPQNYPPVDIPTQSPQPITERQGEQ